MPGRRSAAMDRAIRWLHAERLAGRPATPYRAAKLHGVSRSAAYAAWGREIASRNSATDMRGASAEDMPGSISSCSFSPSRSPRTR